VGIVKLFVGVLNPHFLETGAELPRTEVNVVLISPATVDEYGVQALEILS